MPDSQGVWVDAEVQVDIQDANGNWTGYSEKINPVAITIEPQDPDVFERISRQPETSGQALDTITVAKPQQITLTVDGVSQNDNEDMRVLAAAFSGNTESFSQGAITKATGAFTFSAKLDRYESLAWRNLTDASMELGVLVTDGSGTATSGTGTTLVDTSQTWTVDVHIGKTVFCIAGTGAGQSAVITDSDATSITVASWPTATPDATTQYAIVTLMTEDTDFSVIDADGMVKPLSTGSINASDTIHGLVAAAAISGTQINGAAVSQICFRLKAKTKDKVSGKYGWLEIDKVVAFASDNRELVSGDYLNATLRGTLTTLTGGTEPYRWIPRETRS